ncbi:MAG: DUF1217 domain-containing protein [Acetobacteraceae bacterium]|nr:DUF1217 domain-containing protein [Acetobacteraceae bacterium]
MTSITSPALYLMQSMTGDNAATDLFSIISGQNTGAASTDPATALTLAEKNETQEVKRQASDPETSRNVKHFLAVVAKATDLKAIMNDPIARDVLLTANGLGDQSDYTALATKALMSDPSKPGNFASTLSDPRWLATAKTYNFATQGLAQLKAPGILATVTNGYAEVKWRESLDTGTPGLSAALDFRSRANTIKTVDQILGDSNLRKVVTTALGIPQQIAFQSLEAQEKAISSKIDITKFKDPKFVEQFARRFLLANQPDPSTSGSTSALSLLA